MKIIQNRKEWRHEILLALIASGKNGDSAIHEAKAIEKYVFQDDFIVEISDPKQKEALKKFIDSLETTKFNHVSELIRTDKDNARIALKIIKRFEFATIEELVEQLERTGYGDVNITGSLSK